MGTGDEDKFELERTNDLMSYQSENVSLELRDCNSDFDHTLMGLVTGSSKEVSKGGFIGSVVNSFGPDIWDHQLSSLQDMNCSNTMGIRKAGFGPFEDGVDGTLNMGSNPLSSMLKDGPVLPNVAGMFPQNLTQIPADSGLIERARRFSCFSSGNLDDMLNPPVMPESVGVYSRNAEIMQRGQGVFAGDCSKLVSDGQFCKNDAKVVEAGYALKHEKQGVTEESPTKANKKCGLSPHDETRLGFSLCGKASAEGQSRSAGQDTQSPMEDAFIESSPKELGWKKRKRNIQDAEVDKRKEAQQRFGEAAQLNAEKQQKVEQNLTSTSNKTIGKQVDQGAQASESPKGEYIHMRAPRGQATNSHSLAERVRREKISERMKFLQDLVPGCNKVTGKAVMLDEIINYVQSLQRQVEFLSMKLSTVNPRLEFNAVGHHANNILHPRVGPSSPLGFYPEMSIPYFPGRITQACYQGMGSSSNLFQKINPNLTPMTGGFNESTQLPHIWEDALHNVIQTGYGNSEHLSAQEVDGTMPLVHTKAEM